MVINLGCPDGKLRPPKHCLWMRLRAEGSVLAQLVLYVGITNLLGKIMTPIEEHLIEGYKFPTMELAMTALCMSGLGKIMFGWQFVPWSRRPK